MVISIPCPDTLPYALRTTPEAFVEEARAALAMTLFERGRISSGQAAALMGVSRVEFLTTTAASRCSAGMPEPGELEGDVQAVEPSTP